MKRILTALVLGVAASTANAMLFDRGGGFIYDDVLDITWIQNANANGFKTWNNQVDWAAGLSIVDTRSGAGGVTYNDWRLPNMDVNDDVTIVDCSLVDEVTCRDNEYGYLYYQYNVTVLSPGLFTNIQVHAYWPSTEFAPVPSAAWFFFFGNGSQGGGSSKANGGFAWAVRSGDVSAVPVPAAVWLFGSALGLLGWIRRKAA